MAAVCNSVCVCLCVCVWQQKARAHAPFRALTMRIEWHLPPLHTRMGEGGGF